MALLIEHDWYDPTRISPESHHGLILETVLSKPFLWPKCVADLFKHPQRTLATKRIVSKVSTKLALLTALTLPLTLLTELLTAITELSVGYTLCRYIELANFATFHW